MTDFRFLHAADLHLDSPLRGLESDPAAPVEVIRGASRLALGRLVDLAINESVAFVLLAGDIYDGDWPDFGTGKFFLNQMLRLSQASIPVFMIRGNHDAANRMTRALRPPPLVHLFDHKAAHTMHIDTLGVAVHGQSFAEQAVEEDLSRAYPPPVPGMLNIGLLHTSAEGNTAHASYAPCEVARLCAHGYDYWALGHIHTRIELSQDPWVVFPGNLQGRHIHESGEKGASLVSVSGGRIQAVEHRVLDVLRWAGIEVDLTGAADENEALARVQAAFADALHAAGERHLAARLTLTGTTAAHHALAGEGLRDKVLNEAQALGGPHLLWLEKLRLQTAPPVDHSPARMDHLGRLLGEIDALIAAPPPDLLGDWPAGLLEKLGGSLPAEHALRDSVAGRLEDVLTRARHLLHASLAEEA